MVLQAGDDRSPLRQQALAELLEAYWQPLYCFIRRQGYQVAVAEDLLQAFIANLLERNSLRNVAAGQGRFRSFLLVCLRNFLASEAERAAALKRGGATRKLSLDVTAANARYQLEPSHNTTAERLFERDWALGIIERTFAALAESWQAAGKLQSFQILSQYLTAGGGVQSYVDAGKQLHMTEGAVKTAVHRLRAQFREMLCEQVATTLGNDELLEDEIRHLFAALSV